MSKRFLLIPIILTITGLILQIPFITSKLKFSFTNNNSLIFTPNQKLFSSESKNNLHKNLAKFDYLQPTYIPANFEKTVDYASEDNFTTYFKATDTELTYSGLNLQNHWLPTASYKSPDEILKYIDSQKSKDPRYHARILSISGKPTVYTQSPPDLIDPYFNKEFSGSEEERLAKTNTEKSLYFFTPKSLIIFSMGYTNSISDKKAETELVRMAKSLQVGKIPESLNLNEENNAELTTEAMRRTAEHIVSAHLSYLAEKQEFPWKTDSNCAKGIPANEVLLSSEEFRKCLELLMVGRQNEETKWYVPSTLPSLYISYSGVENFHQKSSISDELEISKSILPKVCFKPTYIAEIVHYGDRSNGFHFNQEYPMYTRAGKVDERCKSGAEVKNCYSCSKNNDYHIYGLEQFYGFLLNK